MSDDALNPASGGDTPAPAQPATPAPPAAATPAAPQTPATGAPQGPGENWVPSYRVRETREAALREAHQAIAQRDAQWAARYNQIQSQLHALVGVQPPANPEVKAVRDQFGQLYPGLSRLEEQADRIQALIERSGDLEAQSSHYWQSYGQQAMDRLFTHAQESLGAPLTEEGKRALHSSFVGFVQSSPELTERYANDPSLVKDFWKAFSSSFIDPVRRTASAQVIGRAAGALPQDTPSGAPRVPGPPQPKDLDERTAQAWTLYQQNARGQT